MGRKRHPHICRLQAFCARRPIGLIQIKPGVCEVGWRERFSALARSKALFDRVKGRTEVAKFSTQLLDAKAPVIAFMADSPRLRA